MESELVNEDEWHAGADPASAADVGSYVASMLRGLRLLINDEHREDLQQLDQLLATAEGEASSLASRSLN